jgi:hypothetical protein
MTIGKEKCKGHYMTAMCIGKNAKGRKIYNEPTIVTLKNCGWCR